MAIYIPCWEYKVGTLATERGVRLEDVLNKFGADGWELMHINMASSLDTGDAIYWRDVLWKRPIQPTQYLDLRTAKDMQ